MGRLGDHAIGGVGYGAPVFVGARPSGGAPARIDLDEFHILRHDDPVARNAAQETIPRRNHAMTVEKADEIILEDSRADVERRAPNAISGGIDKAVAADAAEVAWNMVVGPSFADFDDLAGVVGMRLDGDVTVRAGGEMRAEADGEIGDVAQIGRHAALLHSRVDQHVGCAERDEIGQLQRGHRDDARYHQHPYDFQRSLAAVALNAVDLGVIVEESVVERHAAPNDGRVRVVTEHDAAALLRQTRSNRRSNLIRAQNDHEGHASIGQKFAESHVCHRPSVPERKQEAHQRLEWCGSPSGAGMCYKST